MFYLGRRCLFEIISYLDWLWIYDFPALASEVLGLHVCAVTVGQTNCASVQREKKKISKSVWWLLYPLRHTHKFCIIPSVAQPISPSTPHTLLVTCAKLACTLGCWGVECCTGSSWQYPGLKGWQQTQVVHGSHSNNLRVQRRHAHLGGGTLERSLDAHRSTDHWGDGLPPGAEKPRVAWKEQHSLASCSTGGRGGRPGFLECKGEKQRPLGVPILGSFSLMKLSSW